MFLFFHNSVGMLISTMTMWVVYANTVTIIFTRVWGSETEPAAGCVVHEKPFYNIIAEVNIESIIMVRHNHIYM